MSYASPRADSGIHARRSEDGDGMPKLDVASVAVVAPVAAAGAFCCRRAMKPGMLSRWAADGWT